MKKILSLILILCIAFIQSGTMAAEQSNLRVANAAQDLYDMGLMNGDAEGNLNEERYVTRAEFAALVTRVMAQEATVGGQSFRDVSADHWAAGYIKFVTDSGITEGYGDGCFGPDDSVTFAQAVKMLLSVLGRETDGFSYPMDYMMEAARCALTVGINLPPEHRLNRNEASVLILNSLYIPDRGGDLLLEKLDCKTYYVSPEGTDNGDGSHLNPWKTLKKAAEEVSGYAIIYLEEGTYYETEPIVFSRGGESKQKPLTVKNRYGGAVEIVYEGADEDSAITIEQGAQFVTIKNLSFASNTCSVNIKNADDAVIKSNVFSGGKEAICIKGGSRTEVLENTFSKQEETCVSVLGSARQTQIYNNEFFTGSELLNAAITLGDNEEGARIQDSVIWNNIIFDESDNTDAAGLIYAGTENCHFYNNIIDGTEGGIKFVGENIKPVLKNNIYYGCSDNAYIYTDSPVGIESDYNCFYQTYPQMKEANSKLADPYFVSRGTDWRLMSVSPAAGSGIALSPVITNSNGESLLLDMSDFEGNKRREKWHMGVYSIISGETLPDEILGGGDTENVLLSLDFRKGADHLVSTGGEWNADGGVLWQDLASTPRTTVCYDGGEDWSDYEYSADVESAAAVEGNATGIIFRSDLAMKNMYTFRFLSNDMLEFAKWQDNSFASIEKWEYSFNVDTVYNLKVKAVGNTFTFYVNGEKVREVKDDSYTSGTVGLYCYREKNQYDNMKVVSVK